MRTIGSYLALVLLPVLGLVAILRAGERVEAPAPVHGNWRLDVDGGVTGASAADDRATCGVSLHDLAGRDLSVQQSGRRLVATLAGRRPLALEGVIDGGAVQLTGILPAWPAGAACPDAAALTLELVLRRDSSMAGLAHVPGCVGCPRLGLTARRSAARAARSGH
jgi:hypothetical protein